MTSQQSNVQKNRSIFPPLNENAGQCSSDRYHKEQPPARKEPYCFLPGNKKIPGRREPMVLFHGMNVIKYRNEFLSVNTFMGSSVENTFTPAVLLHILELETIH
jgi:hypothetical protein